MLKPQSIFYSLLLTAAISLSSHSFAEFYDPHNPNWDLNSYSCKDVMRYSGGDRQMALAFLHGYLLGTKGTRQFNLDKLIDASESFIEHCLDHPMKKAVDVMANSLSQ